VNNNRQSDFIFLIDSRHTYKYKCPCNKTQIDENLSGKKFLLMYFKTCFYLNSLDIIVMQQVSIRIAQIKRNKRGVFENLYQILCISISRIRQSPH
jgi:hypothetical protein